MELTRRVRRDGLHPPVAWAILNLDREWGSCDSGPVSRFPPFAFPTEFRPVGGVIAMKKPSWLATRGIARRATVKVTAAAPCLFTILAPASAVG
jgi:hypothetical protein